MGARDIRKVLVVHSRYRERGGEDALVDRELALLRAGGLDARLLEKSSQDLVAGGLPAQLKAAWRLPYAPESRDLVARELAGFSPDLVHVHNFFPAFTPSIYDACREAGVPVVQTLHNFRVFCASGLLARGGKPCELCLEGSVLPALRFGCYQGSRLKTAALARMISHHRAEDTWNTKVDRFVTLSGFARDRFVQGGIDPDKIRVKPNFCFPPSADPALKREGFALFVGRLSEEKGIRPLLAAWRGLSLPLVVAGEGPLRVALEKEANPAIRLLGGQTPESVSRLMHQASFLVLPSTCYENFPLVAAEAFAHALPVIATRLGSLAEIVAHEENGLCVDPGDGQELRNAALRLSADTSLRKRLGDRARADFERLYSPERNLALLLDIYGEVLAHTP